MGITIIRTFSMANAIVETATVDCPLVNLTLTGENKDDTETLTAEGYTDGYRAEVELTWDATYWAVMTDGTAVQAVSFLARTSEDSETTSTANPNGAWFALQSWTVTTVAGYTATSYYVPALDVATADQATGDAVTYSFLMPLSASDSEEGETDAGVGDRLDKGTNVAYFSDLGAVSVVNAATACQAESDKLSLGASALVAGSVAFAAALAF